MEEEVARARAETLKGMMCCARKECKLLLKCHEQLGAKGRDCVIGWRKAARFSGPYA